MKPLDLELRIEMLSDWHVGSGSGRHKSIDRTVLRDHDGLPFIPATTARGMLRDGAQILARGLDDGSSGPWSTFVDTIFGDEPVVSKNLRGPTSSRLSLDDLRLSEADRAVLVYDGPEKAEAAARAAVIDGLAFIKPGIAIDPKSGRVRTDFLRFEEMIRSGAVLGSNISVDVPDIDHDVVFAFLTGAAHFVDRIGGKRRRGHGRCCVRLHRTSSVPIRLTDVADSLERSTPPVYERNKKGPAISFAAPVVSASTWKKLRLDIELLSPAIIPDEVQGNVVTSSSEITGSHLLPLVARTLLGAGFADVWKHIAIGDIRVLPATPEINRDRSLPLPLLWEEPKGNSSEPPRLLARAALRGPSAPFKPLQDGYVSGKILQQTDTTLLRNPAKTLRTHNTIRDDIQRPDTSVGGVYSYEALAANSRFVSEIWIRDGLLPARFDDTSIKVSGSLGRARHAGYGRAAFGVTSLAATTRRYPLAANSDRLRVWLTTDTVLPGGGLAAAGLLERLAAAIEASLGHATTPRFDLMRSWANLRATRIDGWQAKWGLPKPTLIGLQAGSVAEFALNPNVAMAGMREALEREGLGLRRGEGFGCVIVDHGYWDMNEPQFSAARPLRRPQNATIAQPLSAIIVRAKQVAWHRCIEARAEAAISTPESRFALLKWDGSKPRMSQLGGLRGVIDNLETKAGREAAVTWLYRLNDNPKRSTSWPDGAIDTLMCWMTSPVRIWATLKLDHPNFAGAPLPGPVADILNDEQMQAFAIRTLLLLAIRYHKREIERNRAEASAGAAS